MTVKELKAKITEQEIKIKQLEQLLLRSCSFIIDARSSLDIYEGTTLLKEISALNINKK